MQLYTLLSPNICSKWIIKLVFNYVFDYFVGTWEFEQNVCQKGWSKWNQEKNERPNSQPGSLKFPFPSLLFSRAFSSSSMARCAIFIFLSNPDRLFLLFFIAGLAQSFSTLSLLVLFNEPVCYASLHNPNLEPHPSFKCSSVLHMPQLSSISFWASSSKTWPIVFI